jgi:hypothetical protein
MKTLPHLQVLLCYNFGMIPLGAWGVPATPATPAANLERNQLPDQDDLSARVETNFLK